MSANFFTVLHVFADQLSLDTAGLGVGAGCWAVMAKRLNTTIGYHITLGGLFTLYVYFYYNLYHV